MRSTIIAGGISPRLGPAWLLVLLLALSPSRVMAEQPATASAQAPLAAAALPGQDGGQASPPDLEGLQIASIRLLSDGPLRRVSEEDCRRLIELKEQEPFSSSKVKYSIEQLYATQAFFDIRVEVTLLEGQSLQVDFLLFRKYLIEQIEFDGKLRLRRQLLRRELPLRVGTAFSEERLDRAVRHLEVLYQRHGYYLPSIEPRFDIDQGKALISIKLQIEAGQQARLRSVELTQVSSPSESLVSTLDLQEGMPYSKIDLEARLQDFQDQILLDGYLEASVEILREDYFPETDMVGLTLDYDQGPRTEILIDGADLNEREQLSLPIYSFSSASEVLARETVGRLEELHQRKGYFQARADVNATSTGGLAFVVVKGEKGSIHDVLIEGAREIPAERLKPVLRVETSGFFSRGDYTSRLARQDEESLRNIYRSEGFQEVRVSHELRRAEKGQKKWDVVYSIEEGPRSTVSEVTWTGNQQLSDQQIEEIVHSQPGENFSPFQAARYRSDLLAAYEDRGFRDADVRAQASTDTENRVTLHFTIQEGRQTFVDEVVVVGDLTTRSSVVKRQIRLEPGEPYSLQRTLETESNLHDLAVFDRVQTEAVEISNDPDARTVIVRLEEAPRFTLLYGLGFSTFEGPRVTLGLSDNNFLGRAQVFSASVRASEVRQRATISWNFPRIFDRDLPTVLSLTARNEGLRTQTDGEVETIDGRPFEEFRLTASTRTQKQLSRRESLIFGLTFEDVQVDLPPGLSEAVLGFFRQEKDLRLSSVQVNYVNESRDVPSDPSQGFFLSGSSSFFTRALGSQEEFFRILAQGHYYHPLPRDVVLASSLRLGWIASYGRTQSDDGSNAVPISERFFSGGSTSLRGLPQDLAGPLLRDPETGEVILVDNEGRLDPNGRPIPEGGNALIIGNIELRAPLYKILSGTVFYDTGNVFRSFSEAGLSDFSHTFGLGLRVRTPVGPFRFDAGWNPDPPDAPGFDRWVFHISLGQAF
ncbi:MAG TPA: outer membrane protein assembly factor BamA [Acidobacteriota bacterium]|nr:outer membrane protein assembly factor BamA [Acidobacteriota bacterium]